MPSLFDKPKVQMIIILILIVNNVIFGYIQLIKE